MTATVPTHSSFAESRLWLIGSAHSAPVLRLLGHSRWQVEQIPDLDAAAKTMGCGCVPRCVPVVMCSEGDWRKVVETTRRAVHPPELIVLTDNPKYSEWAEVLKANASYLDVRNLDAADLFPLLNLLWRAWHKD